MSKIDKLVLGTVQFGLNYGINNKVGRLAYNDVSDLLDTAYELGVRVLDTAEAYGESHEIIAAYHQKSNIRFNIITKYSSTVTGIPSDIIERVQCHCNDFRVSKLEAYMFHSYDEFKRVVEKDKSVLCRISNSGMVGKIGVSLYTNQEIEDVIFNYPEIQLIQVPFNLFDNEEQRGSWLRRAKINNIEIHTRSTFLQGLFFKSLDSLKGNIVDLKHDLLVLENIIEKEGVEKHDLALNYPFSKAYIDKVLVGVDDVNQLKNNILSLSTTYLPDVFKQVDKLKVKNTKLLNPAKWKM